MSNSPRNSPKNGHTRKNSRMLSQLAAVPTRGGHSIYNVEVDQEDEPEAATAAAETSVAPTAAPSVSAKSTQPSLPPPPPVATREKAPAPRPPTDFEIEMANASAEDREIMQNKIINEEYKIWKKNSVFLYDIMYSRALDWPTLTTQWLPDVKEVPGKASRNHRLLIGTHTSGQQQDFLQIAHINLPPPPSMSMANYNENTKELGGHGAAKEPIVFSVVQKIPHPGEVNKARYQPQNPNIIATWSPDHNVYVWDRSKHPSVPGTEIKPQATLKGHSAEGFAVEWNPFVEGQLISGSEDKTVNLWDMQRDFKRDNSTLAPARTFTQHSAVVNDVQYHPQHGKNLFGSVSDDLTVCIMDIRSKSPDRPAIHFKNAHKDAINSLSFHPKHDKLFATGSADKTIGVFDLRFPDHGKIHSLEGHKDIITKVDWHPMDASIIASSSNDRRIIFWDLSKGGAEQTPEDAEDGPPEMLFMHGGHTNRISDFSWNKNDPWVMCSTGEDNLVQVWRASRHLVETMPASVHRREVSAS
ncbi:Histone acetyltransferase [Pseudocercospora fuligena]|uniref:Histone acetyltransferase n=1 Tax=Pseudocercospora fuligena TaxID=685502 RepID=A0A8H6RKT7_9PEZI|nr:Histone acetyltransferase [Pseudocercospora fuligena]